MRRFITAAICAAALASFAAGSALAAKPDIFKVDVSQFEEGDEAILSAECGFAVDAEYTGGFVVHLFDGPRILEVINFRVTQTFSANGITWVAVRPDSGPDIVWLAPDGTTYLAVTGRSITGTATIGRTVINLDTGELVSTAGISVDYPLDDICAMLTP